MTQDDDGLFFANEEETVSKVTDNITWKVMVVDDEKEIHSVTRLVTNDFSLDGKRLNLISAYSGQEAKQLLEEHPDTAVILLDVIMENDTAGLDVARYVREDLHNPFVRIILRTGQPGQVPEREVIDNYEINDYKEKTELTSTKLYTTLSASLRAYRDLMLIEQHKLGLWRIIKASSDMFTIGNMTEFTAAVLTQLTGLLRLDEHALFCKASSGIATIANKENNALEVLAAIGDFSGMEDDIPPQVKRQIHLALEQQKNIFFDDHYLAYFKTSDGEEHVLYIQNSQGRLLSTFDKEIIELFCSHVSTAFRHFTFQQNDQR